MKLAKVSLLTKASAFFFCIIIALVCGFYFLEYLPAHKRLQNKALLDKARLVSTLYGSSLSRAASSADDIGLLTLITAVSKVEDVTTAYVLGSNAAVISHAIPSEWGKTYTDPLSVKAAGSNVPLLQDGYEDDKLLYSTPINPSMTLCIWLTRERLDRNYALVKNRTICVATFILLLLAGLYVAFLRRVIAPSYRWLNNLLQDYRSFAPEPSAPDVHDECGIIAVKVRALLEQQLADTGAATGRTGEEIGELHRLLTMVANTLPFGAIIADAENRILGINQQARGFFGITEVAAEGIHLFDVTAERDFIELLKAASDSPGKPCTAVMHGANVTVTAAAPDGRYCGIFVTITPSR